MLDSTDPDAFADIARQDRHRAQPLHHLVEVGHDDRAAGRSTNTGTTRSASVKENPGENFVAVTDPGTKMEEDGDARQVQAHLPQPGGHRRALFGALLLRHGARRADGRGHQEAARPRRARHARVRAGRSGGGESRRASRRDHRRMREGGARQADDHRRPEDCLVRPLGRTADRREHGQGGQGHHARRGRAARRAVRLRRRPPVRLDRRRQDSTARPSRS